MYVVISALLRLALPPGAPGPRLHPAHAPGDTATKSWIRRWRVAV